MVPLLQEPSDSRGFFASANAGDGYKTSTFDNLLSYQQEMVQRLTNQYNAIAGADAPEVRPNSPRVLIPAFISCLTARGLDGATPFHFRSGALSPTGALPTRG